MVAWLSPSLCRSLTHFRRAQSAAQLDGLLLDLINEPQPSAFGCGSSVQVAVLQREVKIVRIVARVAGDENWLSNSSPSSATLMIGPGEDAQPLDGNFRVAARYLARGVPISPRLSPN
ncbi:MAG: hypothetical protein U0792_03470 [Gemmataceae bacterium]